jgi:hypothetical protein
MVRLWRRGKGEGARSCLLAPGERRGASGGGGRRGGGGRGRRIKKGLEEAEVGYI